MFICYSPANMAFPAFFSLSQFLFCEDIRYHRSHWPHIRYRFRRPVDNGTMPIFVRGAHRRTVPICKLIDVVGYPLYSIFFRSGLERFN
jgi:hypothetical protein